MGRFRSNCWRRIQIRNQNQPIMSGFWDIWGYVLEKWGFSLFLRLCTGRKKFFWFFAQMSSFSTTIPLQNELINSYERFFFTKIDHITSFPWECVLEAFFRSLITKSESTSTDFNRKIKMVDLNQEIYAIYHYLANFYSSL